MTEASATHPVASPELPRTGGRRRRVRRRHRPPRPVCPRMPTRCCASTRPLRAHPLPALLRPLPTSRRATSSGSRSSPTTTAWRSSACSAASHRRRPVRGSRRDGQSSRPRWRSSRATPPGPRPRQVLLEHLAAAGRRTAAPVEAEVLIENRAMVRVFRDAGYQVSRAFADGVLHLEFDTTPPSARSWCGIPARQRAGRAACRRAHVVGRGDRRVHRSVSRPRSGQPAAGGFTGPVPGQRRGALRARAGLRLDATSPTRSISR
jgi:hypothetical protein